MTENEIAKIIVDVGIKIHSALGPGLYEEVYEKILHHELIKRGLSVESQVPLPVLWDDMKIDLAYRIDMVVEKKVVIELKSVETLTSVHFKQIQTYLKLTGRKLGLLINFNESLLRDGLRRIANGLRHTFLPLLCVFA